MITHVAIGFSQHPDSKTAAQEAALQAKRQLVRNKSHFSLVFMTSDYDPAAAVDIIHDILDGSKMIGSSSAGLILPNSIAMRGILIASVCCDEMDVEICYLENPLEEDHAEAGINFAQMSLNHFGNKRRDAFLFFMDETLRSNSGLLRGLEQTLGNRFPITGGSSSHHSQSSGSFQIYNKNILRNSAVGALWGGKIEAAVESRHGRRPLGKPRFIDKASKNIIETIDDQPADYIYREYFEKDTARISDQQLRRLASLYPLGFPLKEQSQYLLRSVIDILPDGSLICQGEVMEGSEIHLMIGNKTSCRQAAIESAQEVHTSLMGKKAKLIIVMESLTRLKLLGRMAVEEISEIKKILGYETPLIGLYSQGEIAPAGSQLKTCYQNDSIVIFAIH